MTAAEPEVHFSPTAGPSIPPPTTSAVPALQYFGIGKGDAVDPPVTTAHPSTPTSTATKVTSSSTVIVTAPKVEIVQSATPANNAVGGAATTISAHPTSVAGTDVVKGNAPASTTASGTASATATSSGTGIGALRWNLTYIIGLLGLAFWVL